MNRPSPQNIRLRGATPADALCISTLASLVFLDTYATDGIRTDLALEASSAGDTPSVKAAIESRSSHFVLAERAGHLLAFAQCKRASIPPHADVGGAVELDRLYVLRHSHRAGIGSVLLGAAEEYARQQQAPLLWLTAWAGNASANAFYLARGYVDVGRTQYTFGDNAYENRIYSKDLSGAPAR